MDRVTNVKLAFPNPRILAFAEKCLPKHALDWPWYYHQFEALEAMDRLRKLLCYRCALGTPSLERYLLPEPIGGLECGPDGEPVVRFWAAPCKTCQSVHWFIEPIQQEGTA